MIEGFTNMARGWMPRDIYFVFRAPSETSLSLRSDAVTHCLNAAFFGSLNRHVDDESMKARGSQGEFPVVRDTSGSKVILKRNLRKSVLRSGGLVENDAIYLDTGGELRIANNAIA